MENQVFHLCKKRRKRDRPRQRESKNHNISVLFINGDESIYSNPDFFGCAAHEKVVHTKWIVVFVDTVSEDTVLGQLQ
jgi:hypothetical protein